MTTQPPTNGPSREAMDAAREVAYAGNDTILGDASIIDRHFQPLREENTRLNIELVRQRDYHIATITEMGGKDNELLKLRQRLAELEADKVRLDWLEKNPLELGWNQFNGHPLNIFLRQGLQRDEKVEGFTTFRAAIDAALAAQTAPTKMEEQL